MAKSHASRQIPLAAALIAVAVVLWIPTASFVFSKAILYKHVIDAPVKDYYRFIAIPYYLYHFGSDPVFWSWAKRCLALTGAVLALGVMGLLSMGKTAALRAAKPGELPPPAIRANSDAYGSADWMPLADLRARYSKNDPVHGCVVFGEAYRPDLDPVSKIELNTYDPATWGHGGTAPLLADDMNQGPHALVCAGSNGQKTNSVTIPTLLNYTASVIINDPPAQVSEMVSRAREEMGHAVYRISPRHGGHCIDVLSGLDPEAPECEEEIENVITAMCGEVEEKATGDNAVFVQGGRDLLVAILADMVFDPELAPEARNLTEFRRRVRTPEGKMRGFLEEIASSSNSELARDRASTLMDIKADETFAGVYYNAVTETSFLSIASFARMLSKPDLDPADICNGKTTVFLQIPMDTMRTRPMLGRLILAAFRRAIIQAEGKRQGRILFLLDEARFFGRFRALTDMLTGDRKFGISIITMWQDHSDLKAIWKDDANIFEANAAWTLYAYLSDLQTLKHVSEALGKYTILARTSGTSSGSQSGQHASSSKSQNEGASEQGRPLLFVDEIRALRPDAAILIMKGGASALIGRPLWMRRPEMIGLVDTSRLEQRSRKPENIEAEAMALADALEAEASLQDAD